MAAASSSGQRDSPPRIRLATFNIHGFQDAPAVPRAENNGRKGCAGRKTLADVIAESGADIIALQEVLVNRRNMQPLKELADHLGMHVAYDAARAPHVGNAVMSKFPFRSNGLQLLMIDGVEERSIHRTFIATPLGDLNFHSIHLDYMDEDYRFTQLRQAVVGNGNWEGISKEPHFLAGDFNSLNRGDYSDSTWEDIERIREDNYWEPPQTQVMTSLLSQGSFGPHVDAYEDAFRATMRGADSARSAPDGLDSEDPTTYPEATCRYDTRIDFILSYRCTDWKFVPNSYRTLSNFGTSDHRLVVVDVERAE